MANLTTNPFLGPIEDIRREFDQLFERFLGEGYTPLPLPTSSRQLVGTHHLTPQVDMRMDEGKLVLDVDLPGVPQDEVDILLQDGMLTIRGKREDQHVESRGGVQIRERRFGEFERRLRLPEGIDENSVEANFKDGVLSITARMKPGIGQQRRIQVSQGQQGQTERKVSASATEAQAPSDQPAGRETPAPAGEKMGHERS